jgi:hypothetical protein
MAARFDYCRRVRKVSLRSASRLWITAAVLLAVVLPAAAQYPGQITNAGKNTSTLRAVAVLEWTGDEAHPKTSRLVPICIYDGHDLQDAGIYLARPAPIALESEVEYQLFEDGKPIGRFDIETAAREQGSWVGYGKHLPLPVAKPKPAQVAKIDQYDDSQSDTPVLHRKHPAGDAGSAGGGSSGSSSNSSGPDPNAPPPDPDRPTLHKGGDASASSSGDSTNATSGSGPSSTQTSGSSSPTLHRGGDASGSSTGDTSNSGSGSSPASDPNQPQLHRLPDSSAPDSTSSNGSNQPKLKRKKNEEDESYVNSVDKSTDPDRPHLFRGKSAGYDGPVTPSLRGLPPDMHQEVAVSDLTDRPEHVWDYIWANPDDEAKMKAATEDLARTALGLNPPPAPAKPAHKTTSTAHKPARPTLPPEPAPLVDEQFRVFELAYGSGATMVLSAHTSGAGAQEKFVTLVAQPDLYGNVAVLIKNVTDAAHLDDTPRMRLVDAVDALADNRGDLLFELRGSTQRHFALYRVLRGDATRIFVSNVDAIGVPTGQ